jgi:protein TonB
MNAITVNTFPSMNAFTSARSWFLALIVLLHLGFFWALSNGLSIGAIVALPQTTVIDFLQTPAKPPRPVKQIIVDEPPIDRVYVPPTPTPTTRYDEDDRTAPEQVTDIAPPTQEERAGAAPARIEVGPEIDPRIGLTQPLYPAQAIRGNQTGTVLLSVLVLENGRVGEVRIDVSSGHPSLDDSAAREARRWKLKPGTRDGVPVAMWKQIPVTFRLKNSVKL